MTIQVELSMNGHTDVCLCLPPVKAGIELRMCLRTEVPASSYLSSVLGKGPPPCPLGSFPFLKSEEKNCTSLLTRQVGELSDWEQKTEIFSPPAQNFPHTLIPHARTWEWLMEPGSTCPRLEGVVRREQLGLVSPDSKSLMQTTQQLRGRAQLQTPGSGFPEQLLLTLLPS